MSERLSLEDFAALTSASIDDIEQFRSHGLLDPDGDGLFDDADVFRLQLLLSDGGGLTPEELAGQMLTDPEARRIFGIPGDVKTVEEAAEAAGLQPENVRTLGLILGLDAEAEVDESAMEMLATTGRMLETGLPFEAVLEGARVYADSLRRLAEAGIHLTHRYFCEPLEQGGMDQREVAKLFGQAGSSIGPTAEQLILPLYRFYMTKALMAHARDHLEPREEGAPPGSVRTTILFVDLALFSSLADLEGDEAAARVVDRVDGYVREHARAQEGSLVKQIGDEFMLVFRSPVGAVRFAIELHETLSKSERFLALRTGIHSGSALYRMGDYYGHAVNVASRITSMAMPNAILVTEPVAKAAANEGIEVEEIGVRSLRGMEEPLALYRVMS